jgi:hypothetical protein
MTMTRMKTTTPKPTGKLAQLAKIQRGGNRVVLPLVEEHLLSKWGDKTGRDPLKVHVSEMAKKDWCERATWFRMQSGEWPEEKFSFTMQSIFDEGHQIHDKYQTWLTETGKLWGDWECMICLERRRACLVPLAAGCPSCRRGHFWKYAEVSFTHGHISGHEDAAVLNRLVEFKSVGVGTLRRDSPGLLAKFYVQTVDGKKLYDLDGLWKALTQPLMSHVKQANLYLWLAAMMADQGTPGYEVFDSASIVYEYKPNQQAREFVIPLSMDIVEPLIERAYTLTKHTPPPCPYGGCKQCHDHDQEEPARRRLVHRSSGVADRGDDTAAGVLRGSGGRVHRGRCLGFGAAGDESRSDI